MREQFHIPSLLPYLDPSTTGAYLKICLLTEDSLMSMSNPFPFLLVDDSDPISRLIKAQFATDSESKVKEVFLLTQKDEYFLTPSQLAPLANPDIEVFWQKTYAYHCQNGSNSSLITLRRQIDKKGNLVQFQPLFFCRTTKTFFHPPCPKCGMLLQQCYNDQLLSSLGMKKYSASLSRYLFCPSCFSSGKETHFYAHRLQPSDPSLVKSAEDLLGSLGQVVRDRNDGSGLPCIACMQSERCFGPGSSQTKPIVPFSFYPFFMLIHEAMSLNGLDFLALVSGASPDEMESSVKERGEMARIIHYRASKPDYRTHSPFLFKNDTRLFLETLYLKLSFLAKIVIELFPEHDNRRPDPLLYVDRIWVTLTDKIGLLPHLWNFELRSISLVTDLSGVAAYPELPPSHSLHLMGLLWFGSLLINRKQDLPMVRHALDEARRRMAIESQSPADDLMKDSAFSPENIFWNPEPCELTPDWQSLWRETLIMGWSLFNASVSRESLWSEERFVQQMEELRASVRKELFLPNFTEQSRDKPSGDEAIHDILSRIVVKWRKRRASGLGETLEETVMLVGEDIPKRAFHPALGEEGDRSPGTVMLGPSQNVRDMKPAVEEEFFQETILLSGKALSQERSLTDLGAEDGEAALAETVIIIPEEEEPLQETVILSTKEAPQDHKAKGRKSGNEDDLLSETIILTPPSPPRGRDNK